MLAPQLLIFFKELEVNCVLFADLIEENTSETTTASGVGTSKDKFKTINGETMKKFEKDNEKVRHLLNYMTNLLFDLFVTFKSTKIILEELEVKYGAEDAGKKKYMVGEYLHFQITDNKSRTNSCS